MRWIMSLALAGALVGCTPATGGGGGGGATPDGYGVASFDSAGDAVNLGGRFGWSFDVEGADITVVSLRHYGAPGAGAATWRVMIHRYTDDVAMATADIEKVDDAWAEVAIDPVVLSAGVRYKVSGRAISGNSRLYRDPTNRVYATEIDYHANWYGSDDDTPPDSPSSRFYLPPADFGFTVE